MSRKISILLFASLFICFTIVSCGSSSSNDNNDSDSSSGSDSGSGGSGGDSGGGSGDDDISGLVPEKVNVTAVLPGTNEVTVQWARPSDWRTKTSADPEFGTTNYLVYYRQGGNPDSSSPFIDGVDTNATSLNVGDLIGGKEYCFGVIQNKKQIRTSPFGDIKCTTPKVSVLGEWKGVYTTPSVTCEHTIEIKDNAKWTSTYVSGPMPGCKSEGPFPWIYSGDALTLSIGGLNSYNGTVGASAGSFTLTSNWAAGTSLALSR